MNEVDHLRDSMFCVSLWRDVGEQWKEKIGGKRYSEVRNFKKVRKFASSNLKFRSSKFKFTEILICNPGDGEAAAGRRRLSRHCCCLSPP